MDWSIFAIICLGLAALCGATEYGYRKGYQHCLYQLGKKTRRL